MPPTAGKLTRSHRCSSMCLDVILAGPAAAIKARVKGGSYCELILLDCYHGCHYLERCCHSTLCVTMFLEALLAAVLSSSTFGVALEYRLSGCGKCKIGWSAQSAATEVRSCVSIAWGQIAAKGSAVPYCVFPCNMRDFHIRCNCQRVTRTV
jgi:hypothetical protein